MFIKLTRQTTHLTQQTHSTTVLTKSSVADTGKSVMVIIMHRLILTCIMVGDASERKNLASPTTFPDRHTEGIHIQILGYWLLYAENKRESSKQRLLTAWEIN